MVYRVVVPKRVQKEVDRVPEVYRARILLALVNLSYDPYIGKKLEGEYKGQWSYRVWPYRII